MVALAIPKGQLDTDLSSTRTSEVKAGVLLGKLGGTRARDVKSRHRGSHGRRGNTQKAPSRARDRGRSMAELSTEPTCSVSAPKHPAFSRPAGADLGRHLEVSGEGFAPASRDAGTELLGAKPGRPGTSGSYRVFWRVSPRTKNPAGETLCACSRSHRRGLAAERRLPSGLRSLAGARRQNTADAPLVAFGAESTHGSSFWPLTASAGSSA